MTWPIATAHARFGTIALAGLWACGRSPDANVSDLLINPEVSAYVTRVAAAVSGETPPGIAIYASPLVQSFALPDGRIALTTGLLAFMQTESELACVLGHEMAHHVLGHVGSRFAADTGNPAILNALRELRAGWLESDEVAADSFGVLRCASRGYDPLALAHLLYRSAFVDAELEEGGVYAPRHDAVLPRVRRLLEFIAARGLTGSTTGSIVYAHAMAPLSGDSAQPAGARAGDRPLLPSPIAIVVREHLRLLANLDQLKENGIEATRSWLGAQCKLEGVNTLSSNDLDAFGHCYMACEANRSCSGFCGNPGIWYEIARELGYRGDHDSFWQDWKNQNVGASRHDQEGSCYAICDDALRAGELDLTAPQRKWWDCETESLLDHPPDSAAFPDYLATTYGDPHVVTADGLRYDFQAAGEFIAAKARQGDFEIQIRLEPVPAMRASKTTAVAANVQGDRVGVYATAGGMVVRVNGAPRATAAEPISLPRGGTLSVQPDRAIVSWTAGHTVRVDASHLLLDLAVELSPASAQGLQGLFGVVDGDRTNDITTRDGRRLRLPETRGPERYALLYETFGKSWRISQQESLFDYTADESTARFHRPAYPSEDIGVEALDARTNARARAVCVGAGVLSQPWLDDCIFDVGLTGDPTYARSAARAAGWQAAATTAAMEPFATRRVEVRAPGTRPLETFRARAGTRLFFQTVRLTESLDLSTWEVVGPGGEVLFSRCLRCNQPGLQVIPASGEYTSRLTVPDGEAGEVVVRRHVVPASERFRISTGIEIRPDFPGKGAGRIEVPGAVDVYAIQARGGETLALTVTAVAPQLYFAHWTLTDPGGNVVLDGTLPSAGLDATRVPLAAAGQYLLTVSGGDSWPAGDDYGYGDYSILVKLPADTN